MRADVLLLLSLLLLPQAACAQGIGESFAVRTASAGLGAGLAASANHGRVVRRSYESMVRAKEYAVAQTQAITKYAAVGLEFERKKQWANAEIAYTYVLKQIAHRDGPGSKESVPVLKELVKIAKAQNKLDAAVNYQKTVVAFAQRFTANNTHDLVQERNRLSELYLTKHDYVNAAPVLAQTVEIVNKNPGTRPEDRTITMRVYGRVLRQLNRVPEATVIESQITGIEDTAAASTAIGGTAEPLDPPPPAAIIPPPLAPLDPPPAEIAPIPAEIAATPLDPPPPPEIVPPPLPPLEPATPEALPQAQ